MNALVGYTGFVGSNLYAEGKFDYVFNSKNIEEAYGLKPDLLVYAGMRAEKYLANLYPDKDRELVKEAEKNISQIAPKNLVLISTIDVFQKPENVNEETEIRIEGLSAYGRNRYELECWVREEYPNACIIRLPALFGDNIKKNFIYDVIKRVPFRLTEKKYEELREKEPKLNLYYTLQENGFYQCRMLEKSEERDLKTIFEKLSFSAINFTDSRNVYQFYPLKYLWRDMQTLLRHQIPLCNMAVEPISASELYEYVTGSIFKNEFQSSIAKYDFKTMYDRMYGGENGYIYRKNEVLREIKEFVMNYV